MARNRGFDEWQAKLWVLVATVLGFWIVPLAIRTNLDQEARDEIAQGLSSIPFSSGILKFVEQIFSLDPKFFAISNDKAFLPALLVLLVQTLIQSPLLLLLNNTMGPVLFKQNPNEYSVLGDWNSVRTRDKILRRIGKLMLITVLIPTIAFFCSYFLDMGFTWIDSQAIFLRVIIYVLLIVAIVALIVLPFFATGVRKFYWAHAVGVVQRISYVFITNIVIIAVVATFIVGSSGQFLMMFLALFVWMTIYSDTDGFLERRFVGTSQPR